MDWHTKILEVLVFMPGFLFSLSVHEAAHGFVAWRFGDSTAKDLGRVTVNPVPHIDVLGTLILPILGLFTGFLFGWGKPVPVDYRNLKNVKRDGLYIAAAGPVSNMILAFGFAGLVHLALINETVLLGVVSSFVYGLIVTGLVQFVFLNLALCFFNLIPVQPLDGGKILYGVLPISVARPVDRFTSKYGMVIILLLIMTPAMRLILWPPIMTVGRFLLPGIL